MVGNGCTGTEIGVCSGYGVQISTDFYHARGLFSDKTYNLVNEKCATSWMNPNAECMEALNQQGKEIGRIDVYDIYGVCDSVPPTEVQKPRRWTIDVGLSKYMVGGPDECLNAGDESTYLNQQSVYEALNVADAQKYFKSWAMCANIPYTPTEKNEPRDIYPTLVANYDVLIYNGDVDGCVPMTDNEAWTSGMGYPEAAGGSWHPWMLDDQVAGYATNYDVSSLGSGSFQFITVHGSGHMVPQYQPARAYAMLTKYLSGKPF
jgi:hypothetical protein